MKLTKKYTLEMTGSEACNLKYALQTYKASVVDDSGATKESSFIYKDACNFIELLQCAV